MLTAVNFRSVRPRAGGEVVLVTNREIIDHVKRVYGFRPATCWIAHARHACRQGAVAAAHIDLGAPGRPCPPDKAAALVAAMQKLGGFER